MNVVTANRLRDGVAIYLAGAEWTERIDEAEIAQDKAAAKALLERAESDVRHNRVVAPYLITVARDSDRVVPKDKKERMRAVGPSVRRDLNRPTTGG